MIRDFSVAELGEGGASVDDEGTRVTFVSHEQAGVLTAGWQLSPASRT